MTDYKNKVLFLRVSKEGNHLYAFDREGGLGDGIGSILMNRSELEELLNGEADTCKVSLMKENENEND